ncbi:hypothetical protein ACVDG3_05370 [Meridianimarinicoccus sp. RP-17]|uniref:hypothetical protein n=1 Tax=Meridianimarinicoccus zhengii TaxID=2056810 RepID=UPI0013A6CA35|nr:hypothetical protein [Phycocomes zhengii]
MIHSAQHIPAAVAAPSIHETTDTAAYFDPRLRIVTAASLRRDASPVEPLDQMFGYFDA